MRRQAESSGAPLPEALQNRPELRQDCVLAYTAWESLFSTRAGSDHPIPWTAVYHYSVCYTIDGELREDLMQLVRALDNFYLQYRNERRKAIGSGGEHTGSDSETTSRGYLGGS